MPSLRPWGFSITCDWRGICSKPSKGIPPGSCCRSSGKRRAHVAFHVELALPPAWMFLLERCWGRTGGEEQTIYLNFYPRSVKIVVRCGATSFFLTVEGLCLNFSCKLLTIVSFSPPLDSSAHAIVFSNSRCQSLGLGWGQWTLTQSLSRRNCC